MTQHARKRFGQHFLHDRAVVQKIVDAVSPTPTDRLVEIGPGLGAITLPLLERAGRLDVVELDRDLVPELEARCAGHGELRVHQADALRFDFCSLAGAGPLRLVGNLPYNISTPLLFHLLKQHQCLQDMHFMLQLEVADRMVAAPGTRAYGRLTVMLALHCDVTRLFRIEPGAFTPPPKVRSAFLRIRPFERPPFAITSPTVFSALVRQAFSMRRKTVRNALRRLLPEDEIRAAGIDPGLRPDALAPAQFAALAERVVLTDEPQP